MPLLDRSRQLIAGCLKLLRQRRGIQSSLRHGLFQLANLQPVLGLPQTLAFLQSLSRGRVLLLPIQVEAERKVLGHSKETLRRSGLGLLECA